MHTVIDRIFKEKAVTENKFFHIVDDIEPVCADHFLLLPKNQKESFIDLSSQEFLEFNKISVLLERNENRLFFEKGRSSFCTSFNGPHYGHCHVVPSYLFEENIIKKIIHGFQPEKFNTIEDASNVHSGSDYEYLMFGYLSGPIFFKRNFGKIEKRFIRKFLSSNLKA
jgi:diadenosine tetraphosphate (Ap4A) HIT family hydrolase